MKNKILLIFILANSIFAYAQKYPEMVKVEGGTFIMGNTLNMGIDNEKPAHKVTLDDFFIGKTEITVEQYRFFCEDTGNKMPREPIFRKWKDNEPIVFMDYRETLVYCEWLTNKTGNYYTLPSEAQWEYAARGGQKSKGYLYSGSNNPDEITVYIEYMSSVYPVAQTKPNELGIYDMSSNVYEWCLDWYSEDYYKSSEILNPKGPDNGRYRVIRGGYGISDTQEFRVTYRNYATEGDNSNIGGFRVVRYNITE